jgi:cbb3-type cytochrome oxidase maturation protein
MNIIYYLIPVAIIFVIIGVLGFFWATKTEQFDDLEKQGLSILSDDDVAEPQEKKPEE